MSSCIYIYIVGGRGLKGCLEMLMFCHCAFLYVTWAPPWSMEQLPGNTHGYKSVDEDPDNRQVLN